MSNLLFSPLEIFDLVITVFAIGYIFRNYLRTPVTEFTSLADGRRDIINAALVVAPAIILHEFGHKFVAMAFGFTATYRAAYEWLMVGGILSYLKFPFIFFVPAYVSIIGAGPAWQFALISITGPLINLALFGISWVVTKYELVKGNKYLYFYVFKQINKWLFLFNLIPLPGTDGYNFINALLR
jgi:Zn-dependent protease